MYLKWIGAILIVGSCSCCGFSLAFHRRREIQLLENLDNLMEYMLSELSYRLTPLPTLIRNSASQAQKPIRPVLIAFAGHLERQLLPDAASCMNAALSECPINYQCLHKSLLRLGHALGRFDYEGQRNDLLSAQKFSNNQLHLKKSDIISNQKSFQVLGICGGIALTIILL